VWVREEEEEEEGMSGKKARAGEDEIYMLIDDDVSNAAYRGRSNARGERIQYEMSIISGIYSLLSLSNLSPSLYTFWSDKLRAESCTNVFHPSRTRKKSERKKPGGV
jgi:hypothetical protein